MKCSAVKGENLDLLLCIYMGSEGNRREGHFKFCEEYMWGGNFRIKVLFFQRSLLLTVVGLVCTVLLFCVYCCYCFVCIVVASCVLLYCAYCCPIYCSRRTAS